jgi:hypothetical protein
LAPAQQPGVAHSQPSVSGAVPALQSLDPALHVYEHVEPLHFAAPVLVLQLLPQAPQLVVDESDDSQPFVLGGCGKQSAKPAAQPVYEQLVPEQVAPLLFFTSHVTPQSPQFVGDVIDVSHPLVSGGVALQSLNPALQLEYSQTGLPVVLQAVKLLCAVSQASPHALQVIDWAIDSQPSMSGGSDLQST